jgi:hypothetical protein
LWNIRLDFPVNSGVLMMHTQEMPIFIGGTGRSGTTIMSKLLSQHPDIFTIKQELKLATEPFGLVRLLEPMTEKWGVMEAHLAIRDFIFFSEQLRYIGFHHPVLRWLDQKTKSNYQSTILHFFPGVRYSSHPIAKFFGLEHYDHCIQQLLDQLIYSVDRTRPVDTHGVLDPFYIANRFEQSELIRIFQQFLDNLISLRFEKSGRKAWCDDTPRNIRHIDFLLELFPRMKFIHMIRDPRDIIASYNNQRWASQAIDANTHVIAETLKAWQLSRSRLPMACYLEVKLETLIAHPEATLRHICNFLDVPFHPDMLTVDLSKGNIGRYTEQMDAQQIERVETRLADWMIEQGYLLETSAERPLIQAAL